LIWKVDFSSAAQKELRRLDKTIQDRIIRYCRERLETEQDPRRFGEELIGDKSRLWRYRIGDYRLICEFEENHLVVVALSVGHRREVYQ